MCGVPASVKAAYYCLRMFLLVYYRCCRVGNWLPLVRFSSACTGSPVRWIAKLFFFYFKCPLASSVCVGCYVEGGRKRRRGKEFHLLLSSFLNRSPLLSLLGRVISTQVLGKTPPPTKRCCCFCVGNESLIYYTGKRTVILSQGFLWSVHCAPSQSFTHCGNQANKRR